MTTTLDIVALRSLVGVATYGGFHRAAHALHLTQAAVSRHVQRLEDALGQELVERDGRATRFTAAGERLLGHADEILAAHDDAVAALARAGATLTVGAMDHVADSLLPELLALLRAEVPAGTEIRLRLGRSARLRDAFARGQVDVALVLERLATPSDEVGVIPTRWVGPEQGSLPEPVQLVLFDHRCGLRTSALDALRRHRVPYVVAAEASDLADLHAAVRAGVGVTLLPDIGPLPDRTGRARGLPDAAGVVVSVRTGPAVPARVSRLIRSAVERSVLG